MIRWHDTATAAECRRLAAGADSYFGKVEAVAESGTPITPAMLKARLERFLYVVIHEDCHEQFELPYGIEEALCNLIAYRAMERFSDERFQARDAEDRAIRRYASVESQRTRATIEHYGQLELLYARYDRRELTEPALMRERSQILGKAARALAWKQGPLNNIGIASHMTYSRHYPFLEDVMETLGGDLARTVGFFRHVDRIKPSREAVMEQHRIASAESAEFIRTYEAAVLETIRRTLALQRRN